ncbi:MAG: hemoglobin/transferrin/lactoferrin receptor protein, partial [Motiliproteus sp.]
NGTSNFLIDRDQQTRNASIDYRIDTRSPLIHSQITAYWNNIEMNESRVSDGRHDSTALDVLGLNINNLSMFGDIAVLYGIDGYTEEFRAERNGSNRPIPPDAETDVWGGFVQATIPLAKSWALELGTRYDYFATEAINLGQDRSDNDLSPSAALVWQSTDWLELTLRHDRAFRAPSSEEMYSTGTHFCMGPGSCNTFLPNPDLKAEQAANTELLAAMQFVNVLGGDLLNINASVFENRVDDFVEQIVEINAGNTTWVNVDEAKITGFEVSADYNINRFRAKLAYGQTRGEDNKTGEDLTNIPADTLTGDLSYRFWNNQLMTGFRVTYADDQNKTNYAENSDNKKYDSYSVADVYASWEPQSMKAFKVDLTVNNILDKHYSRAWEELDETGREMIVAARYKF